MRRRAMDTEAYPPPEVVELRRRRDWTQEDLAHAAGIHVRTLQRYEVGERVKPATAYKITRALDSTPEDVTISRLDDEVAELWAKLEEERAASGALPRCPHCDAGPFRIIPSASGKGRSWAVLIHSCGFIQGDLDNPHIPASAKRQGGRCRHRP